MDRSLKINIRVSPSARKERIIIESSGRLKCTVNAAAEKGRANQAVITLLATKLNLPKRSVEIIQGATSVNKVILIHGLHDYQTFLAKLGLEQQANIFSKTG